KSFGKNPQVASVLSRLGTRFRDPDYFPKWRATARNAKAKPADRIEALELLAIGRDPELGNLAREALSVPPLRSAAISALRQAPGKETANALVAILPDLDLKLRNEAINLLGTRPEMALVLLEAVDAKEVAPSLVSPVMLDQFERFENEELTALIDKNWMRGGAGVDLEQLHAAIEDWKKKLTPKMISQADVSKGRQAYMMTCGTCHQLFGEGIAMGPDLTGSNRADLGYILENVLAPNAVVSKEYMLNIFTMKDGSTLSGMIASETPEFVKLSMPGGTETDVKKSEIANRQEMEQSLMPAGLFDALPIDQVAALVKYLASPSQVPMPGETPAPSTKLSRVLPPPAGGTRNEGESLVEKYQPERGEGRAQGMGNFNDEWSGDRQLWWVGGKPGDVYTLKLEGVEPGTKNLTIYPTTAKDYARVKFSINGQLREADFYSEQVKQGEPLYFEKVNISPTEPLQIDIHLLGSNAKALPRHMVGIDRIEVQSSN
ncbi:MAG: c-type cytochrome, partial [Verrucomicrobiota bacterium]